MYQKENNIHIYFLVIHVQKAVYLSAKAMMELGSLSHTAIGTLSCSYIR